MSNINIKRAVENIRSGTTAYTPVIELVVNAIQAIRAIRLTGGAITVTVLRDTQIDLIDKVAPVDGFIVQDNGVGFDQENRDSFDTLYTELKTAEGGKGFGRFTCLKYFQHVDVVSAFKNGESSARREFSMGTGTDIIINEKLTDSLNESTGTTVKIYSLKEIKFPDKGLDVIARVIVEKLLPYLIDPSSECPTIGIVDEANGQRIVLNEYLTQSDRQIVELSVPTDRMTLTAVSGDEQFAVRVFKFYAPRTSKSKISLVAHRREVTDVTIQTYVPEFSEDFYDKFGEDNSGKDRNFIVKAYVFGSYLDRNVSLERGAFNFHRDNDLVHGISQSDIERAAAQIANKAVGGEIELRKERKLARIRTYVDTQAPWHRELSKKADFSALPMRPTGHEIELHLQATKFEIELKARADVTQILSNQKTGLLELRVADVVESVSQTSKNDLIHYVSMRKCVLDLFGKSLELGADGKYSAEADVHQIIMPRWRDTEQINYEDHNLWILDERLNFAEYVSSDKPLDGKLGDRTDLAIYGRRIAFRVSLRRGPPCWISPIGA